MGSALYLERVLIFSLFVGCFYHKGPALSNFCNRSTILVCIFSDIFFSLMFTTMEYILDVLQRNQEENQYLFLQPNL